jgi:hypothetical protein
MTQQIDQAIAALCEAIYVEARETIRNELVADLLSQTAPAPAPKKPLASGRTTSKPATATKAPKKFGPGPKRSPEELAKTATDVAAFVKANPGSGAEAIKTHLGLDLAAIELPIKKLLASKAMKKRGKKRATKYYPV